MRRQEKSKVVGSLREKLEHARVVLVAQAFGLDSGQAIKLRRAVRQAGGELRVAKNTLARLAVQESRYADLSQFLAGPTALVFGYDDPVAVAKALVQFSGEAGEKLAIKGGGLEGRTLDAGAVKQLGELPPRGVLLGTLLGLLQAPAVQLLRTMQEPGARLVRLLERHRSRLESS